MLTRLHEPVTLLRLRLAGLDLSPGEEKAITSLPVRAVSLAADQSIIREADRSQQSCILLQGLACSSKVTGEGKRQIVGFHLPGDMPDLLSFHLGTIDTAITTMTPARIGIILHEHLEELFTHRRLAAALWRAMVSEAAIHREWVVNVGRRRGIARTAHLLCELVCRMEAIGAIDGDNFELPLTQEEMADALGLSIVHVNRSLQVLRQQGLITWRGPVLRVLDRPALMEMGDFNDDYLHLAGRPGDEGCPVDRRSRSS